MACSLGRQPQVGCAAKPSAPEGQRKRSAKSSFAPSGLCGSGAFRSPGLAPWATRHRLFEASRTRSKAMDRTMDVRRGRSGKCDGGV